MPAPDTPISAAPPEQIAALEGVLRCFWRLIQGIAIYDRSHPAARAAASEAAASSDAIDGSSTSTPLLRVTPDGFLLGEAPLSRASALADLAALLHRLRVAMLGIPAHATPDAFLSFAAALAGKKSGEHWTQQDSDLLATSAAADFRVYTVTYDALRSGASDPNAPTSRFDWSSLARALCPGSAQASTDELALAIEQTLKPTSSPSSPPDSPTVAEQLALTIQTAPDEDRQSAVTKVSALIERLSPEGRARLLKIDESRAAESLAAVSELCDSADAGDILFALDRVGDSSKLVCPESVRLLTKIALTGRGDQGITAGLRQVVSRATSSNSSPRSHQIVSLLRSFQQLMERSSADRFNPADYEQLLQQLTSATTQPASAENLAAIRARWTDPCLHTSHLLAGLTGCEHTTPTDAAGIYTRLHAALDAIADSGDPSILLQATQNAPRTLDKNAPPKTSAAIRQFTLRLGAPEAVRRILASASPGTDAARAAMDLFASLGPAAVCVALQDCVGEAARPDVLQLPSHPLLNTPDVMAHLVRSEAGCAIRLLRARTLPATAQAALAALLVSHRDVDVSADAFTTLHACQAAWSAQQIAAAIAHPRPNIRVIGIDKSRTLPPDERQSLVKPILTESIDKKLPLSVLSAAVHTIADSGPEGQRMVLGLCGTLLRRLTSRRFDTLLAVMDILCDPALAARSGRAHTGRFRLFLSIMRAAMHGATP